MSETESDKEPLPAGDQKPGKSELSGPESGPRAPVQNLPVLFLAAGLGLLMLLVVVGAMAYVAMSRGP